MPPLLFNRLCIGVVHRARCTSLQIHQVGLKYAPATIGRDVKRAKQFFQAAIRKRLIADTPFAEVKPPPQVNKRREHFITSDVTETLIAACPDAEWRVIVTLAPYGGCERRRRRMP